MAIKTIIFDFGNVVGFFDHHIAMNRVVPFTDMSIEEMYSTVYAGSLEEDFESGRVSASDFLHRIRDLCNLRCDLPFLASAFADIFHPNPEVCDIIPQLKPRYRVLLGSNTNEIHATQFRQQFSDCLSHFDNLVLSHEIGRKPHGPFFEHCQRLAACERNECLFIDDLASNIAGARQFGWQAIEYAPANGLRSKLHALGIAIQ